MKLLIIGASGMIGSRILSEALARGHEVIAAARSPDRIVAHNGVATIKLDATDSKAIGELAAQVDLVISATSPRSTGNPHDEAKAIAEGLIKGVGITGKRLVMVGGAGTLNLPDGTPVAEVAPEAYREEARAMRQVFEMLEASDLNFTFLAPAGEIAPGDRTGKFRLGGRQYLTDAEGNSRISTEDYAIAFLDEVEQDAHSRQVFTVAY